MSALSIAAYTKTGYVAHAVAHENSRKARCGRLVARIIPASSNFLPWCHNCAGYYGK